MSTIRNTKAVITETAVLADEEMSLIIVDDDNVLHVVSDFINFLSMTSAVQASVRAEKTISIL